MGKTPVHTLRISDEDWKLIAEHANEAGLSVSEFLRSAAMAQITSTRVHTGAAVPPHTRKMEAKVPRVEVSVPKATAGKARTGRCPHGRRKDEFCARCD